MPLTLASACSTCGTCQTAQHLVHLWTQSPPAVPCTSHDSYCRYVLTPELSIIIGTISSPLPLAACLWCMMSARDRFRLRNNVSGVYTCVEVAWRFAPMIIVICDCDAASVHLVCLQHRPSSHATDVCAETEDGIERGAALARDRMHINLPNTSLLSNDQTASPMLQPFNSS